ncbi:hypothetical protein BH09BAC6_BH09BAC6_29260 [soil metagenome]
MYCRAHPDGTTVVTINTFFTLKCCKFTVTAIISNFANTIKLPFNYEILNRILLFIFLLFISAGVKAQEDLSQITFGAGSGIATAFGGTKTIKSTTAFYGNVCYYPTPFFDLKFEFQAGKLAGGALTDLIKKNFVNNYQAFILESDVKFGALYPGTDNAVLKAIGNIYVGAGVGLMSNHVTNINNDLSTTYTKKIVLVIPVKIGYEFNLLRTYDQPRLKADLSLGINTTKGNGLDGYYDNFSKAAKLYIFASVGFKYAIDLGETLPRRRFNTK